MKIKALFLSAAVLLLAVSSCEKEDGRQNRNTGFDVPELTESNTIAFTATVQAGGQANVTLDCGRIAVDWGDGEVTKDVEPGKGDSWRSEFTHRYKSAGEYRVRIWSDEVSYIHLSSLLHSYGELHVGECPVLTNAMFNSMPDVTSLDLNGCPSLEYLNLGNCEKLETLDIGECSKLEQILTYTNPALKKLDAGNNDKLSELTCHDCGLEELLLPRDIMHVELSGNNLKSLSLTDYKKLTTLDCRRNKNLTELSLTGCDKLNYLYFSGTGVGSFDFSGHPELFAISCSDSKMTSVDVSGNKKLRRLECAGLGLTALDISNNVLLQYLYCYDNKLTALDVSKNSSFRDLFINGNELDKENLEAIFTALPSFKPSTARSNITPPPSPYRIKIHGNPGAATCNTTIITDKGWVIETK